MVHPVKLPDVGEGVAEAELVDWHVAVGDPVTPDSVLAEVLTDKATVEIYAPVGGVVSELHGEPGEVLAVGSVIVVIDTGDAAPSEGEPVPQATPDAFPAPDPAADSALEPSAAPPPEPAPERPSSPRRDRVAGRAGAAPAVRARARRLGIDLATVLGSGPGGRVLHVDLDRLLTRAVPRPASAEKPAAIAPSAPEGAHSVPVRGVRKAIAERLTAAWTGIPHITYVEAVDATELERLRARLNEAREASSRLTILPFIARAIVLAVADQPQLNAHYDPASATLAVFDGVHVGIATQTSSGLLVPVVHHAERRPLEDLASEAARLAAAARAKRATRAELSGSTITISSLGALGGLVTTPILNAPEVAIVGINKLEVRPVWHDGAFTPRQMFNISASFDHRIVDGYDAATFVQRIKTLLESPSALTEPV